MPGVKQIEYASILLPALVFPAEFVHDNGLCSKQRSTLINSDVLFEQLSLKNARFVEMKGLQIYSQSIKLWSQENY